jgi:hypothetical protein
VLIVDCDGPALLLMAHDLDWPAHTLLTRSAAIPSTFGAIQGIDPKVYFAAIVADEIAVRRAGKACRYDALTAGTLRNRIGDVTRRAGSIVTAEGRIVVWHAPLRAELLTRTARSLFVRAVLRGILARFWAGDLPFGSIDACVHHGWVRTELGNRNRASNHPAGKNSSADEKREGWVTNHEQSDLSIRSIADPGGRNDSTWVRDRATRGAVCNPERSAHGLARSASGSGRTEAVTGRCSP